MRVFLIVTFICVISIQQLFSQKHCNLKEVKVFNLSKVTKADSGVLVSIYYHREDNQVEKIEHFDSLSVINRVIYFEFDSIGNCVLSFEKVYNKFQDSCKAETRNNRNIPIRSTSSVRDLIINRKLDKAKFNECNDPLEVKKYDAHFKDYILSWYRYEYIYW